MTLAEFCNFLDRLGRFEDRSREDKAATAQFAAVIVQTTAAEIGRHDPMTGVTWVAAGARLEEASRAFEHDEPGSDAELKAAYAEVLTMLRDRAARGGAA